MAMPEHDFVKRLQELYDDAGIPKATIAELLETSVDHINRMLRGVSGQLPHPDFREATIARLERHVSERDSSKRAGA